MDKKSLQERQKMSSAEYVNQASSWANTLIERESRGNGDTDNAMRRLEARYGIPHNDFWRLRYRPPKRIFVDLYERLKAAYETQRAEQIRRLQHEIEITEKITGPDSNVVRSAKAFIGADVFQTGEKGEG